MGRLIDIDRLCNDLAKRWSIADKKKEDLIRVVMADVVTPIVVSQPTVDAVEVIRCRDCKLSELYTARDGNQYYYCVEHGSKWQEENDYCSFGKRKDGEHDRG